MKGFFAAGNLTNRTWTAYYPRHAKYLSTVAYKSRVPETYLLHFFCFYSVLKLYVSKTSVKICTIYFLSFKIIAHQSVWRGPSILGIPQGSNHGSINIFRRRRLVCNNFLLQRYSYCFYELFNEYDGKKFFCYKCFINIVLVCKQYVLLLVVWHVLTPEYLGIMIHPPFFITELISDVTSKNLIITSITMKWT